MLLFNMDLFLFICSTVLLIITAIHAANGNCCNSCCDTSSTNCQSTQKCECDYCCKSDVCKPTQDTPSTTAPPPIIVTIPPRTVPPQDQTSDINISNTLSNRNEIHIPITITNENVNTFSFPSRQQPVPTSEPIQSTSIGIVPTFVTVTSAPVSTSTKPDRCCNVIVPCLGNGCQTHYRTCSHICVNQHMYFPVNPCEHNPCFRHEYYNRYACSSSWNYPYFNCGFRQMDCGGCQFDFYRDFYTYNRCSGCFYY